MGGESAPLGDPERFERPIERPKSHVLSGNKAGHVLGSSLHSTLLPSPEEMGVALPRMAGEVIKTDKAERAKSSSNSRAPRIKPEA